jgi:hypothetical protein
MGNYNDIYMRAYLGDPGNVPRSTSYPLSASPDLIPYGTQPVTDVNSLLLDSSWNQVYDTKLVINQTNYLYMRAQNLGTTTTSGVFSLYYAPSSLLLWPSVWQQNQLLTQAGESTQTLTLAANAKGVTPSAFAWNTATPPSGDHYCLIGMVSTPGHPATVPTDGSITNFANWIANTGSFAWHNVSTTSAGSPTWTKTVNYEQGTTASDIYFQIVCSNVPVNSQVAFSCGEAGPTPPINLPKTTVTNGASFIVGMQSSVPANFTGDISYSYWSNGIAPTAGFSITIQAMLPSTPNDALYVHSSTLEELGMPKPEDYLARASIMKGFDNVEWKAHQAYADMLRDLHTRANTYGTQGSIGPTKFFPVGTDSVYAQMSNA